MNNQTSLNPSSNRCLVLGGNGFIGSHLVDALLEFGYKVTVFDRPNTVFLGGSDVNRKNVRLVEGDITCDTDLINALEECDYCFHLVSTLVPKSSNLDPIFDIETNLIGTVKLLNHAVKSKVKKIIFLSSGGTVYGPSTQLFIDENHPTNPLCSYGITKLAIEKYLNLYFQLYGLDYMVLRLSNPFGERQRIHAAQGAIAAFLGKALQNKQVEIWGDGSVIRDYIHISDVVSALMKSMTYAGCERTLNIGSGHGLSLNKVLDDIELITEKIINRVYSSSRVFDVPSNVLSIERAINALDWKPTMTFVDGLNRMKKWIDEHEMPFVLS